MRELVLRLIRNGGPIEALDISEEIRVLCETGVENRAELEAGEVLTFAVLCRHLELLEQEGLIRQTVAGWERASRIVSVVPKERMLFS